MNHYTITVNIEIKNANAYQGMCMILEEKPVIAIGFFDYVKDPQKVIAHLRNMTSNKFIASFPASSAFRVPFRKFWLNYKKCSAYFFNRSKIKNICEGAGFKIDEIIRSGPIYLISAH